jgi:hypothetical protein
MSQKVLSGDQSARSARPDKRGLRLSESVSVVAVEIASAIVKPGGVDSYVFSAR